MSEPVEGSFPWSYQQTWAIQLVSEETNLEEYSMMRPVK